MPRSAAESLYALSVCCVKGSSKGSRSQNGKRSRKSAYGLVKIKNRSHKRSYKRDGIGVGRIRTFPFSSNFANDPVVYLVKTRLSESEAEAEG